MPISTALLYHPAPERADAIGERLREVERDLHLQVVSDPAVLTVECRRGAWRLVVLHGSLLDRADVAGAVADALGETPILILTDPGSVARATALFPGAIMFPADPGEAYLAALPPLARQVLALAKERSERRRLALLPDAVPALLARVSPELRFIAVNRRMANHLGMTPEACLGQPLGFGTPTSNDAIRSFARNLLALPDAGNSLELPMTAGGESRHFLITGHVSAELDEIVLVGLDVTDQKQSEALQQRQLQELALLQAVAVIGAQATDEDELIDLASQIVGNGFFSHNFGVLLVDEAGDSLRVHPSYFLRQGRPFERVPMANSVAGLVAMSGHSVRLDDVAEAEAYFNGDNLTRSELCVPLKVGYRIIGVINAESPLVRGFSAEDERLMTTIAGQLAIAIERLRREANERRQARQLTTIYDVARRISAILDPGELLSEVVSLLARHMNLYNAAIALVEGDRLVFKAGHGGYADGGDVGLGSETTIDDPLFAPALRERRSYLLGDVRQVPGVTLYDRLPEVRAHLTVPLLKQEAVIGVLTVSSRESGSLGAADAAVLEILADQISAALQNAHLYEALRRQAEELSGLYETALATSGVLDKEALFERLYQQVRHQLQPDVFLIAMYEPVKNELRVVKAMEENERIAEWQGLHLPLDEGGLTGWVMQQRDTFYVRDAQNEMLPVKLRGVRRLTRTWLGIPLMVGRWLIGALSLQSFEVDAFSESQRRFAASIARQFALALQNAQLYEQAQQRTRQLATLNELASTLNRQVEIGILAETVAHHLVEAFGYDLVSLYESVPATGEIRQLAAHSVVPGLGGHIGYNVSATDDAIGRAIRTGRSVLLDDARHTDLNLRIPDLPLRSALILPLQLGGRVLGALAAGSLLARNYDDNDRALLQTVSDQLAAAIDRSRLFEETKRRAAELELLSGISSTLRDTRTVEDVLAAVMPQALQVVHGVHSELWLLDLETGDLVLRARHPQTGPLTSRRHRPGEGITGTVAKTGQLRMTRKLGTDPLLLVRDDEVELYRRLDSNISLPVRAEEKVIGVLHVGLEEERDFTVDEVRLLTAVADIAGSALFRAQVMETLEEHVVWRTRELARANEQLKELDRLKSKFVSDISHELRTPMANLRLYADLLARGRPERREHYLSVLQAETLRLIDVVEPILSYSRIGLSLMDAEVSPVSLNGIVEEAVAGHQNHVARANVNLILELAADLPNVNGEEEALRQLFANLLSNALTYGQQGTILVKTGYDERTTEAWLAVQDEGIGIPAEDLPHIFDWFYRGQRAGQSNIPGTGLGLAMVKVTVERFGGRIDVESQVGRGSTFRVWLPVAARQIAAPLQ